MSSAGTRAGMLSPGLLHLKVPQSTSTFQKCFCALFEPVDVLLTILKTHIILLSLISTNNLALFQGMFLWFHSFSEAYNK